MQVPSKRLNYSTFTQAILKRTLDPLDNHLSFLNCAIGCKQYWIDEKRYIPSFELSKDTLSKMLNEIRNPPRFIIGRIRAGDFHGEKHIPTPEGFGVILENIQSPSHIADMIQEICDIIQHDPYMTSPVRKRLLNIRSKKTFLFECFIYILSLKKGNTAERLRREEASRRQKKASENSQNISQAARDLFDEEQDRENDDESN